MPRKCAECNGPILDDEAFFSNVVPPGTPESHYHLSCANNSLLPRIAKELKEKAANQHGHWVPVEERMKTSTYWMRYRVRPGFDGPKDWQYAERFYNEGELRQYAEMKTLEVQLFLLDGFKTA